MTVPGLPPDPGSAQRRLVERRLAAQQPAAPPGAPRPAASAARPFAQPVDGSALASRGMALPAPPAPPAAGPAVPDPDAALGSDPAYMAFLRSIGAQQSRARNDSDSAAERVRRRLAMQLPELAEAGTEQRRQISGGMETRGLYRSGEHEEHLGRQRAAEGRAASALEADAADHVGALEQELSRQLGDLDMRLAEARLEAADRMARRQAELELAKREEAQAAALGAPDAAGGAGHHGPPTGRIVRIGQGGHRLDESAASSFTEAQRQAGVTIKVTDSYRTYDQQADLYRRKPGLAAPPGKSLHEKGLAIDVANWQAPGVREALLANGWHQFDPKKEPWHFSYGRKG